LFNLFFFPCPLFLLVLFVFLVYLIFSQKTKKVRPLVIRWFRQPLACAAPAHNWARAVEARKQSSHQLELDNAGGARFSWRLNLLRFLDAEADGRCGDFWAWSGLVWYAARLLCCSICY
jgi:hypothetical protein